MWGKEGPGGSLVKRGKDSEVIVSLYSLTIASVCRSASSVLL